MDCVEDHTDYVQCLCVEAGWVATHFLKHPVV